MALFASEKRKRRKRASAHRRSEVGLMAYPSTPTSLYINGFPEKAEKLTKNTDGTVAVSAVVNDPDSRDKVRMVVRYSSDKTFKSYSHGLLSVRSARGSAPATMTRLSLNTLYYVRVYTQQRDRMLLSRSYNASSFWTAKSAPTGALAATSRERLYLNRFGTGFTQRALTQLRAAGTPEAWLATAAVTRERARGRQDRRRRHLVRAAAAHAGREVRPPTRHRQEGLGVRQRPRQLDASCAGSTPSAPCSRR